MRTCPLTVSSIFARERKKKEEKKKGKESKVRPDAAQCVQGGGRLTGVQENTYEEFKSSLGSLSLLR